MKSRSFVLALLLPWGAIVHAQWCPTNGYGRFYNNRPFGGIYSPYHGWGGAQWGGPAYPYSSRALTDEDLFQGAKLKGDRLMSQDRYTAAAREYENAARRATRAWGGNSTQAQEAIQLITQARQKFERFGDARSSNKSYLRARSKGDRYFARRDYDRAARQYQDALARAHTDIQAKQAAGLLVKAQRAAQGTPVHGVARIDPNELEATGDRALAKGRLEDAASAYAGALTSARRRGASSVRTAALAAKLTDVQGKIADRPLPADTD